MRCQKNFEATKINEEHLDSWRKLKTTVVEQEKNLQEAQTEKEIQKITKNTVEIFMDLFGKNNPYAPRILFVTDCDSYSDSAKGNGYIFLQQLYHHVHGVHLDDAQEMPTNDQWYSMFQALKPDLVETELERFFENEHISKAEYEGIRRECLRTLHAVKDLLKVCLDRKWDLWFSSDFQTTDLEVKSRRKLQKQCSR